MSRKHEPNVPKVERIELSEKNIKLRWILVCVFAAIALVAFLIGIFGKEKQQSGWKTVESGSTGLHCGHDFLLTYEFGAEQNAVADESEALPKLYTTMTETGWQLFYDEAGETPLGNLYRINSHPNQEVTIEPVLYEAFRLLEEENSRLHYLGPVYAAYDQVFLTNDALLAADLDPGQNQELRQYVLQLAQYAADPSAIRLELRQDNKVFLHISDQYMAYLEENMVETYVDFGWLRNAFVIDYMAKTLEENGFTNGSLTSVDGFSRCLDQRGNGYALQILNYRNDQAEGVATMEYVGPASLVSLRTYASSSAYRFPSGRLVTYLIDPADGQSKPSLPNLVSYSTQASCAQIALRIAPSFIADSFSADGLNGLTAAGIYSVWCEEMTICHNQPKLSITPIREEYTVTPVN